MKRFRTLMFVALMACASFVAAAVAMAVALPAAAYCWAKKLVLNGFKMAAGEGLGFALPIVTLVQAKAFVMRLAKRERPELTGSWRMCPST